MGRSRMTRGRPSGTTSESCLLVAGDGDEDQAVDALLGDKGEVVGLALGVFGGVAEHQRVAVLVPGRLRSASRSAEEGVGDVGDEQGDGVGLAGAEGAGEQVGAVAERVAASRTRSRVALEMRLAMAPPERTRETVLTEVLVAFAMSIRVGCKKSPAVGRGYGTEMWAFGGEGKVRAMLNGQK